MIWVAFAFLTSLVILAVSRPLWRRDPSGSDSVPEIEIHKLQLAEVMREAERGTLPPEEAQQMQTEIGRRLLRLNRKKPAIPSDKEIPFDARPLFAGLAFAISIGALGLYLHYGRPDLPDQPLEARLNAPPERQPIQIQIAKVERRLREHPDDATGWNVIAPVYFRLNQFQKAADAYRRAILLAGPSEDNLLGLGEALTFGNDGTIPDAAKKTFQLVVQKYPNSAYGRFWLAVIAEQEGRKAEAEKTYRALIAEDVPENLKIAAMHQLSQLGGNSAPANQEASNDVMQGPQGDMIRGMVEGLAARLKQNGADLDGWLKLIRSYTVLKETAKASEAVENARAQFASNAEALEKINALQRSLGLAAPQAGTQAKP